MTSEIHAGSRALRQVMKAAILFCVALITINGCAAAPSSEPAGGSVQVRTISEGGNALDAPNADTVAAFDDASFRSTWAARIGTDEPPPVIDFSREAVVFVFGGMRNTGGYSVDVRGATIEGDTLVVDAVVQGPPGGAMVTQVITYPFAVVAVTPRAFRSVRRHETAKANPR